jgi:hypothetical protein
LKRRWSNGTANDREKSLRGERVDQDFSIPPHLSSTEQQKGARRGCFFVLATKWRHRGAGERVPHNTLLTHTRPGCKDPSCNKSQSWYIDGTPVLRVYYSLSRGPRRQWALLLQDSITRREAFLLCPQGVRNLPGVMLLPMRACSTAVLMVSGSLPAPTIRVTNQERSHIACFANLTALPSPSAQS